MLLDNHKAGGVKCNAPAYRARDGFGGRLIATSVGTGFP
jgi:hypothetical protein